MTVIDIDGGDDLSTDLQQFRLRDARCYAAADTQRLLGIIETAVGDHGSFDSMVRSIMSARKTSFVAGAAQAVVPGHDGAIGSAIGARHDR